MTPWTASLQGPLSMGFSRQEYCHGLQFPSPGHLPDPEIKPTSLSPVLAGGFFITEPPGKPITSVLIKGGRRIRDKGNVTTEAEGQNQRLEDAILLAFFLSDFKQ